MFGVTCTPHPDALFVDHAKWPHSLKQYLDEYVSLMWCFNVFQGCCVPGLNDLYAIYTVCTIFYHIIPYTSKSELSLPTAQQQRKSCFPLLEPCHEPCWQSWLVIHGQVYSNTHIVHTIGYVSETPFFVGQLGNANAPWALNHHRTRLT